MPASRPSVRSMAQKTIVLVSGANQGIGFEIVKKLSSENPNYQILLGSRDSKFALSCTTLFKKYIPAIFYHCGLETKKCNFLSQSTCVCS